jgi:hypothetical protein
LCDFADSEQVEATLKSLMAREDGPFIARLPRAAGARESRYAHLFSGVIESVEESAAPEEAPAGAALSQRVTQLEEWVQQLRVQVGELTEALKGAAQPPPRTPTGE